MTADSDGIKGLEGRLRKAAHAATPSDIRNPRDWFFMRGRDQLFWDAANPKDLIDILDAKDAALRTAIAERDEARAEREEMTRQRDLLAKAIADAAQKAGIYNGQVPLTGPHLLMLCDDLADNVLAAEARLEELTRERDEAKATGVIAFAKVILHGDDEHRDWLAEAAACFIAGKPLPEPRGKGKTEAALEARLEQAKAVLEPFGKYLDTAAFDLDNHGEPLPDDQGMGWVYLTIGDFRRARAFLHQGGSDAR